MFQLLPTSFDFAKMSVYNSHVAWQMRIWKYRLTFSIIRRAMRVSMVLVDVEAVEFRRLPPCMAADFSSSAKIDEILWKDQTRAREMQLDVQNAWNIWSNFGSWCLNFLPIVLCWEYVVWTLSKLQVSKLQYIKREKYIKLKTSKIY